MTSLAAPNPFVRWLAPLIALAIAALLHVSVRPLLGEYVERVALDSGIAIILAVSLNIVNGYTGQFSIGHAAFYALGGYAAAGVTYYASLAIWNSSAAQPIALPWSAGVTQLVIFVIATLIGGLVSAGAGWVVGLPSLRLRGDYLAIVTLGFGEILRVLLQQTSKQITPEEIETVRANGGQMVDRLFPPPVGGSTGFINIPDITTLFWVALFAGVTIIFAWRLKYSTFGRSMIALRENEVAAEAMGVNVTHLKVRAFVFAAFFAGIAGSLYAHQPGTVLLPQEGGFVRSFDIVIMVVLGGLGSISGAALAAVLLTAANEWLRDPTQAIGLGAITVEIWYLVALVGLVRMIAWRHNRTKAILFWACLTAFIAAATYASRYWHVNLGDYRMIIYALVLILVMIGRPSGLFGTNEITDLLPRHRRRDADNDPQGFKVVKP